MAAPNKIQFNGCRRIANLPQLTRIGGQPSIDRVFEEVSGMKSFPFLAGNKSIAGAVFIGERLTTRQA